MTLRKNYEDEDILGLKLIGIPLNQYYNDVNTRGAIVEKIKKGSVADIEGHIKPGKYTILY